MALYTLDLHRKRTQDNVERYEIEAKREQMYNPAPDPRQLLRTYGQSK